MTQNERCHPKGFVKWFLSWRGVALTVALGGISYYLLTEHKEHLALALPYLFLLACPLMHIFGHGHRGHESAKNDPAGDAGSASHSHDQ